MVQKDSKAIAVVIPAFMVRDSIQKVIRSLSEDIAVIVVVDDCCPEKSGDQAAALRDPRVVIVHHEFNRGVGGAMVSGYRKALELGSDLIVKMDGDGQMDADRIPDLLKPLQEGRADYAKGNRLRHYEHLRSMPKMRLFGNSILSFAVKMVSGYWNVMDPTNGFTVIKAEMLRQLPLHKLSTGYYFETDMLARLHVLRAVVRDVEMPAVYGSESSNLRIRNILFRFPLKLTRSILRRLFLKYYIYDFNMASIYLMAGLPLFLFGGCFGLVQWILSVATGIPRTAGTIMLSAVCFVVGLQMLLSAIQLDIANVPDRVESSPRTN
ncbi:MAG: glycosyltransferase family 2 protein [Acidobacteria bacterium]|uniref:Glycosyltransferase family 2 protein n=1 Tax=Candidatus Polarisedimenticola svalbardensis TaxID=2886004 RepID=A0A8J7CCT2_9BACT|nr:glycosyltransferase family 2 protein [Candidatus Polarisedimenticola svalbardensis]